MGVGVGVVGCGWERPCKGASSRRYCQHFADDRVSDSEEEEFGEEEEEEI